MKDSMENQWSTQPSKTVYYTDELNEEFSEARIVPRVIDKDFRYFHGGLWNFCSLVVQNVLSMPIKVLYQKLKFHLTYVGKEKLKGYKNEGYFIYANHTQPFADTFIPSVANYPHRNFFIVNPENVSMPGMRALVEMLGAIPIPCDMGGMKNFVRSVEDKIRRKYSVTIYPEAHIWPYYTGIRNFKAVSFRYPVKLGCPVFCLTNTYRQRRDRRGRHVPGKADIVTYIDGPFFPDESLTPKERQQELRDRVYGCMLERSRESDIEVIAYRRAGTCGAGVNEAEVSEAEVSGVEVSEAEVGEAEVSEAEVSGAEVNEAEVSGAAGRQDRETGSGTESG